MNNFILSLKRAAVKLAITADLVLLLAALGSLNIPTTTAALLALNLLCGCFYGDLAQFREIVKKTHGDSKYAKEYLAIADLMELHLSGEEEKQEAVE